MLKLDAKLILGSYRDIPTRLLNRNKEISLKVQDTATVLLLCGKRVKMLMNYPKTPENEWNGTFFSKETEDRP